MLRAQRYKTPLSLILFDIDHFKAINDTYGHQVGDNVLVDLSGFIAGRIRHSDVLARWGGEEFVILTPACTVDMAFRMAANLAAAIRSHAFGAVGKITCSFGVVEFEDSDTAETLMARVDEALYLAKMNGRDRAEMALRHPVAAPHLAPTA
ncbi:MAG: GGDEF domain-containing protein [Pseudolabrys sp.]